MSAQFACDVTDVAGSGTHRVELEGARGTVEVAVVRDANGDLHAINDVCSHGAVSLSDGEVDGTTLECWLHGSVFDLHTGKPLSLPATEPVPVYPLIVVGESVFVDVDAPKEN